MRYSLQKQVCQVMLKPGAWTKEQVVVALGEQGVRDWLNMLGWLGAYDQPSTVVLLEGEVGKLLLKHETVLFTRLAGEPPIYTLTKTCREQLIEQAALDREPSPTAWERLLGVGF